METNRKISAGRFLLVLVLALLMGCGSEKKKNAENDGKSIATADIADSTSDEETGKSGKNTGRPAKENDMKLDAGKMKKAYVTYGLIAAKSEGITGVSYSELEKELGEPDEAYERIHVPKDEEYGPSIWRYKTQSYMGSSDVSSYVWYLDGGYYINAIYDFQNSYMSSIPNQLMFGVKGGHFLINGTFPFKGTYWYDVYKLTEEDEKTFAEIVDKIRIYDEKRKTSEPLASKGVAGENEKLLEELFGTVDRTWGSGFSYMDFDYGNFTVSCLAMGYDVTPVFIGPCDAKNKDVLSFAAVIHWDNEFKYGFDMEYANRICALIDDKTTLSDVKAILGEADLTRKNEENGTEYCYNVGKQTVYISEHEYGLLCGIEKSEHNGKKNFRHDVRKPYDYACEQYERQREGSGAGLQYLHQRGQEALEIFRRGKAEGEEFSGCYQYRSLYRHIQDAEGISAFHPYRSGICHFPQNTV